MAVGRIKLEKRQYQTLAKRLKPHTRDDRELRLLRNELARAAERPGLTAEISRVEAEVVVGITADMPDLQARFAELAEQIGTQEALDRDRTSRLRARMDAIRGGPPA